MDTKEKGADRRQGGEPTAGLSEAVDKLLTDSATRLAFTRDPVGTLEGLGVSLSDEVKEKCRAAMDVTQMQAAWPAVISQAQTLGPPMISWPYTHTQTQIFTHGPIVFPWTHTQVLTSILPPPTRPQAMVDATVQAQVGTFSPTRLGRVGDLTGDELQGIINAGVDRLLSGLAKLKGPTSVG